MKTSKSRAKSQKKPKDSRPTRVSTGTTHGTSTATQMIGGSSAGKNRFAGTTIARTTRSGQSFSIMDPRGELLETVEKFHGKAPKKQR